MTPLQATTGAAGLAAMLAGLVWSAASDLRHFIIPNRACALVAGGYVLAAIGLQPAGWLAGLATGLVVLALGAALFARGWVGGGDVKLAAAVSLWAGPALFSGFLMVTSVAAVLLAVLMLSPLGRSTGAAGAEGLKQPMPFGAPLAAGGAWVGLAHLEPIARTLAS